VSCTTCPEQIVEAVASNVRETMARVQRVKRLTSIFQRILNDIAGAYLSVIVRRLDELYALIPEPPIADLAFYQGLVTCPLTPLAFALEPELIALVDPRELIKKYKEKARQFLARVENYYDMAMADLEANDPRPLATIIEQDYESLFPSDTSINSGLTASAWSTLNSDVSQGDGASRQIIMPGQTTPVQTTLASPRDRIGQRSASANIPVRIARKYVRELVVALQDPVDFAVQFAETTAAVEYVRATCSDIYYSRRWPFVYWYDTVTGFEFDSSTGLPGVIDGAARDIAAKFMQIELKLFRWQAFITLAL
jgi:hypothetical protein